jgi:hypothetical protein
MATPKQVRTWIQQAEADLRAARVDASDLRPCHQRYWLQQSYEKAIKAYALMRWNGDVNQEPQFNRLFLLQHSPIKTVTETDTPLSKSLHLLRREVQSFIQGDLAGVAASLLKIDATTPRHDPEEVSYRYPFLEDGEYVAPAVYEGWDGYQGNLLSASGAVERLLQAVKDELKLFSRKPK